MLQKQGKTSPETLDSDGYVSSWQYNEIRSATYKQKHLYDLDIL